MLNKAKSEVKSKKAPAASEVVSQADGTVQRTSFHFKIRKWAQKYQAPCSCVLKIREQQGSRRRYYLIFVVIV